MTDSTWSVLLFNSVSHALRAEKILKGKGIPHKLIPVPRQISSDCGVCLRFTPADRERILEELAEQVEIREIRDI